MQEYAPAEKNNRDYKVVIDYTYIITVLNNLIKSQHSNLIIFILVQANPISLNNPRFT